MEFTSDLEVQARVTGRGDAVYLTLLNDYTEDDLQAAVQKGHFVTVNGERYRLRGLERYMTIPPKPPLNKGETFLGLVTKA